MVEEYHAFSSFITRNLKAKDLVPFLDLVFVVS